MLVDDNKGVFLDDAWRKFSRHSTVNAFQFVSHGKEAKAFIITNNLAVEAKRHDLGTDLMHGLHKSGSASKAS